ncbi:S8 family serine peptidase [Noviluteimonas gilva]|uniref:S8 family serine peptidase n=1 Tax=Noviluteimonas gilva TaxID=2682097 RepID=A0A7C9HKE3_9GAMM|nr:S8 family serine peptidase [Lysobacter gilvus]MUV12855.1 S8 family serine peptidase [Lysobacter gilvus]
MQTQLRLAIALACFCISGTALAFDPAGRVVVKFHEHTQARVQPAIALRTLAPESRAVSTLANGAQVLRVEGGDADAVIARLAAHPDVQYARRDPLVRHTTVVDDPWYEDYVDVGGQWHNRVQADLYDPLGGVNAPGAWAQGAMGEGIVVGVLDTGITAHPDLDANVVAGAGYDFITDAFISGREDDTRSPGGWDTGDWTHVPPYLGQCPAGPSSWHGTHVAGTIAAVTNNGLGMAGMAYRAKLLPVRVLGHCGGYMSDVADAVTWASGGTVAGVPDNATPAEVLNISLGARSVCEPYMQDAIDGAVSRGTTVVVAAGNSNQDVMDFAPANCSNVIVVGANGFTGKRVFYSNHGAGVTVSAPGGGLYRDDKSTGSEWMPHGFIWSTFNFGMEGPEAPAFAANIGTSMAAPHVAAVVAMMQGAAPVPHAPATIATMLAETTRMFPVAIDKPIGTGIVDAGVAVEAAILGHVPLPVPMVLGLYGPAMHIYAKQAQSRHYVVDVPDGATRLTLRSYGGTGDADLYVRRGGHASPASHDVSSVRPGNNGIVVIDAPAAGELHVAVHGAKAFSGVQLRATVE